MLLKYLTAALLLLLPSVGFAQLNLVLTQGVDGGIPIAIAPFGGQASLADIISADLQHSGRFHLLKPDALAQAPHTTHKIDPTYWRTQGVDNLVIGKVVPVGEGKLQVTFSLLDFYANAQQDNAPMKILLEKTYHVQKGGLRRLAHQMSDAIYQKLTGVPGCFDTRIAYVLVKNPHAADKQYLLEVADADGFNPQPLLISKQPIMSPAWSPDAKEIAYVSFENHRAAIFIQDIATGKRHIVAQFSGINGAPAWSHDGQKLALVLTKDGSPKIYTLDVTTQQLTQVTHGQAIDTEPNWSPNDQQIIFTSNRGGGPQIYQVNLSDQSVKRITYQGNYNARASFSAAGKAMVMLHREDADFNIALQDLASGRLELLTRSSLDESPSLSPNGSMVLYATKHQGKGILAMVSTDGKVHLQLPSKSGNVRDPAWSVK